MTPLASVQATSARIENLAGLIERVTFHNEENGFCVLRLKAHGQRDLVTVVGNAAMISAGEWVQAAGTWTNDRTHGLQFRAAFLKAPAPTTLDGIERYLGSGMIRGLGPAYAKRLVRAFGDPVQNMDDVHISQFAALLRTLKRQQGRRIVLAVYDRSLFDYLALELSPTHVGDRLIKAVLGRSVGGNTTCTWEPVTFEEDTAVAA